MPKITQNFSLELARKNKYAVQQARPTKDMLPISRITAFFFAGVDPIKERLSNNSFLCNSLSFGEILLRFVSVNSNKD